MLMAERYCRIYKFNIFIKFKHFMVSIQVSEPTVLKSGSRVILGKNHVFRYHHPEQAVKIIEEKKENNESIMNNSNNNTQADWEFAQSELLESDS